MHELYLDYNVFIELEDIKGSNNDIYNKIIDKLKNFKIFYSYAHTEELVFAKLDDKKQFKAIIKEVNGDNIVFLIDKKELEIKFNEIRKANILFEFNDF